MDGVRDLLTALPAVPLPLQLVVLTLLLGCGAWAVLRPGVLPLVGLGACVAMWLRANSRLEGVVLVPVTPAHGLTLADLLVPLLCCGVLLARVQARPMAGADPARTVRSSLHR